MNNKGFAISTLIYGLSIMGIMLMAILMSTMSSNRNNTRTISEEIEKGLISYSKTETSYTNPDTPSQYITPDGQAGWYRVELWGAQGGSEAYGAYTSGLIKLEEGDILNFYIGKKGDTSNPGGSTDVRIIEGGYDEEASYNSRIMVAAGGGKGTKAIGGTLAGYSADSYATGGKISAEGVFDTSTNSLVGYPTTYTTTTTTLTETPTPVGENGGGSGYYSSSDSQVGGTSYIAGYAGCGNAYYDKDDNGKETYYYFVDGMMIPGVNKGDGKAKLTKVASEDKLNIVNEKFKDVKAIKDCLPVTSGKNHNITINADSFKKAIVVANGTEENLTNPIIAEGCATYTLTSVKDLDEIAVWHETAGVDYYNHTIEVQNSNNEWQKIKDVDSGSNKTDLSITETVTGIHISAYQYDSTENLPETGNYYIVPVLEESKVLTAPKELENINNPITASLMTGEKNQIWSIEKIDSKLNPNNHPNEYRIIDLARYKAMSISKDENKIGNSIVANKSFNNTRRNEPEIWEITPVKNGTYTIKTVMNPIQAVDSGYIVPKTQESSETLMIGKNDKNGQRYRLISTEYKKSS